jgi:TetR/AcrR family transcriptional regulator
MTDVLPEKRSDGTRRKILDAAEEEFAAKGFDGARLSNIARGAGVQQALIHHYFSDKAGLYKGVIARAMEGMTAAGWDILDRFVPKKRKKKVDVRGMIEAFAHMLLSFYAQHGNMVAILRHEAMSGGPIARKISETTFKPQFEEIVRRLEELREAGEIADVDPRHLCISVVALASFPFTEESFLSSVWPIDPRLPSFLEERKKEVVEMVLARLLPKK